jgi:hypothetical protein
VLGPGAGGSVIWRIGGSVKRLIRIQPATFLSDIPPSQFPTVVRFPVEAEVPLARLSVRCDSDRAQARVVQRGTRASAYEIEISIDRPAELGPFRIPFFVDAIPEKGESSETPGLIEGIAVPEVVSSPRRAMLGALRPGEVRETTVELRSCNGAPFAVRDVRCSDEALCIERLEGDMGRVRYRVKCTGAGAGPVNHSVRFLCEMDDGQEVSAEVPVAYHVFRGSGSERSRLSP